MAIGIGIIGLPQSGKTTVFNALTHGRGGVSDPQISEKPTIGVAKVPDIRLDKLAKMFSPQRVTPAEVRYVDIPSYLGATDKPWSIGGQMLNTLQQTDALILVLRSFDSPSVAHPEGSLNPHRDLSSLYMELAFSDLAILERREERLNKEMRTNKASDRDRARKEHVLISQLKTNLENDIAIRDQSIKPEDRHTISNYQFLTDKPILVVLNLDENQLTEIESLESDLIHRYGTHQLATTTMCAKLEMELGQMTEPEEEQFRKSLDAGESGASKMIRSSFNLLGLCSFFTVGPDEVKAWTITIDEPASTAARRIHSDIERGFIRAEVVSYDNLVRYGGIPEARKQGVLRSEGKTYPVQDGDVVNFLFNV